MNSKFRSDSHIELYLDAEEIHFLAHAATDLMRRVERGERLGWRRSQENVDKVRELTNALENLSIKIRGADAV
jgi:hypothetical protein